MYYVETTVVVVQSNTKANVDSQLFQDFISIMNSWLFGSWPVFFVFFACRILREICAAMPIVEIILG